MSNSTAKKLEHVKCNQCGADDTRLKMTVDGYSIVECKKCFLMYVNPRLAQSELEKVYSEEYYQPKAENPKFFANYAADRKVRTEEFERKLEDVTEYLGPKRGKLLDIGCAMGFFLDAARKSNFDCEGVEISAFSSDYARKELGLKVFTGTLEQAQFPSESFDVVTSWDCVEHVPDPTAFLHEVKRILKKDGMGVIETMNMDGLGAIIYKENFKSVVPEAHIYYFTVSSFLRLLNKVGFQTIHIDFPYFKSRWYTVEDVQKQCEDLIAYKQGQKITRKNPAFWGNLVTFYVKKA